MTQNLIFGVCVVDFHHLRGPEIEYWKSDSGNDKIWPYLPFQALPDGSHSFEETFSYFTLLYDSETGSSPESIVDIPHPDKTTTLFGLACTRHIDSKLLHSSADVTRSAVQKAVVVIAHEPIFGQIKDKLSIVTNAYFSQHDFKDVQIIDTLYDNLRSIYSANDTTMTYIGLSVRKLLFDLKRNALVILKAMLLEKRVVFFGSDVEQMCQYQFAFISLIPNLIQHLRDSGSPVLEEYAQKLTIPTSFTSSDKESVLKFLGFPLQIFGKGGLLSPYTPLQQVDDLQKTHHFVIGTSNSLLVEQDLAHVLINIDKMTVEIKDPSLTTALSLSYHDKKWIDGVVAQVYSSWNENDDATPKQAQFEGSEDHIRLQFEDYLTGLVSAVKYHTFESHAKQPAEQTTPVSPLDHFNEKWIELWSETTNYDLWQHHTDEAIFDVFEPRHAFRGNDPFGFLKFKKTDPKSSPTKAPAKPESPPKSPVKVSQTEEEGRWSGWRGFFGKKSSVSEQTTLERSPETESKQIETSTTSPDRSKESLQDVERERMHSSSTESVSSKSLPPTPKLGNRKRFSLIEVAPTESNVSIDKFSLERVMSEKRNSLVLKSTSSKTESGSEVSVDNDDSIVEESFDEVSLVDSPLNDGSKTPVPDMGKSLPETPVQVPQFDLEEATIHVDQVKEDEVKEDEVKEDEVKEDEVKEDEVKEAVKEDQEEEQEDNVYSDELATPEPERVDTFNSTPVEETPVEETPVEETPVEETPVEETPVEETPVEETPVEETPVEETPVEETPVEETPVETQEATKQPQTTQTSKNKKKKGKKRK